ncbi:ArsR family transcriptional regulator [Bradyrhizobium daqingense]|uniref:DNA-binding transcriptional ArsR family regulator n=1 Tax=Bradyrhizobium daqingense TaxID=993502 RepID=A0A562LDR1_9BRAD|nr:ArsR family transcriptional regulator [Bradyrhizobium daqingense]TWI05685.1 DNA-binding transcriptional ArsR family regulator [Bradyrhizobium daqingense]UFS91247.1 ArsR family transcriptional regulator [Bradyrhizobium daqingense]
MSRTPHHPTREQIELPMVLDCLSDPIRLAIVYQLAQQERVSSELRCSDFSALSGKSNLAYHFAKLRECGLMQTRIAGTNRFMRLRREDMEARFPGLLDAVLSSAAKDADRLPLVSGCDLIDVDRK